MVVLPSLRWLFLNPGVYVHTTRAGKFAVWADLQDRLELNGTGRPG
jgi:hypothetical protein